MKYTHTNPCIRCGTERVVKKTWKKKVDSSLIEFVQAICPDPSCQKIVDLRIKTQRDKNEAMRESHEKRVAERKAERARNKKTPAQ